MAWREVRPSPRAVGGNLASKPTAINMYVQNPSGVWVPVQGSATGNPNVNVAQFGGINTQMGAVGGVALGNVPEVLIMLTDGTSQALPLKVASASSDGTSLGSGAGIATGIYIFNGATWNRLRDVTTLKSVTTVASGNTALWTPTLSKKFRIMRWFVQVTSNAVAGVAGILEVTFQDSTTPIPGLGFSAFIPGAAGTVIGSEISTPWIDMGSGFLSAAANNVLNVNLSFALTGGEARAIVVGTEE